MCDEANLDSLYDFHSEIIFPIIITLKRKATIIPVFSFSKSQTHNSIIQLNRGSMHSFFFKSLFKLSVTKNNILTFCYIAL